MPVTGFEPVSSKERNFLRVVCIRSTTPAKQCTVCNTKISKRSKTNLCKLHFNSNRPHKIQWPSKEELQKMVWTMPLIKLSQELKVSDASIRKRCLKLGIKLPPGRTLVKGLRAPPVTTLFNT